MGQAYLHRGASQIAPKSATPTYPPIPWVRVGARGRIAVAAVEPEEWLPCLSKIDLKTKAGEGDFLKRPYTRAMDL